MCDKELLVSYLYDELQGPERKAFQHHLASCRECQDEVQGLRATRAHLVSWAPPEPAPGFRVPACEVGRAGPRFRISPAWGLAAAAALVLAVASAIANVEVRLVDGGVTIRTGWTGDAISSGAVASVDAAGREALVAVQQRVRELEVALAAQQAAVPLATTPATFTSGSSAPANSLSDAELLRRVRLWITESEQRQDRQFAARFVQGLREMQAAHSMDLVRLEQAINQHQGAWSDEVFRQREELKQVFRLVNAQQR
jgi:hypothetical protein